MSFVSGHGFGHASRSIEVINALIDRRPQLRVVVRSQVAPWLFGRTARPTVQLEPAETDTGVAQIDSLNLDERETLARAHAFMNTMPARIEHEASRLRELGASLVVADLPPLGIAAAKAAGIPAVAFGNFTICLSWRDARHAIRPKCGAHSDLRRTIASSWCRSADMDSTSSQGA